MIFFPCGKLNAIHDTYVTLFFYSGGEVGRDLEEGRGRFGGREGGK